MTHSRLTTPPIYCDVWLSEVTIVRYCTYGTYSPYIVLIFNIIIYIMILIIKGGSQVEWQTSILTILVAVASQPKEIIFMHLILQKKV